MLKAAFHSEIFSFFETLPNFYVPTEKLLKEEIQPKEEIGKKMHWVIFFKSMDFRSFTKCKEQIWNVLHMVQVFKNVWHQFIRRCNYHISNALPDTYSYILHYVLHILTSPFNNEDRSSIFFSFFFESFFKSFCESKF